MEFGHHLRGQEDLRCFSVYDVILVIYQVLLENIQSIEGTRTSCAVTYTLASLLGSDGPFFTLTRLLYAPEKPYDGAFSIKFLFLFLFYIYDLFIINV